MGRGAGLSRVGVLLALLADGGLALAAPWTLRVVVVDNKGATLPGTTVFLQSVPDAAKRRVACIDGVCRVPAAGAYRLWAFAPKHTTVMRDVVLEGRDQTLLLQTQPHFAEDPPENGTGRIRVLVEVRKGGRRWVRISSLYESVAWDGVVAGGEIVSGRLPSGKYVVIEMEDARPRWCAIVEHSELEKTTVDLLRLRLLDPVENDHSFAAVGCLPLRRQ